MGVLFVGWPPHKVWLRPKQLPNQVVQVMCENTGAKRSGLLDSTPEGPFEVANVIPPAFSSWGDPQRSRSPPHLQAAQRGTAAKDIFPLLAQLYQLCLVPLRLWAFMTQLQNGQAFFPLYTWSTDSGCGLYQETLPSQFFIIFYLLLAANSYPLFKFPLRWHFQVRELFLDPCRRKNLSHSLTTVWVQVVFLFLFLFFC